MTLGTYVNKHGRPIRCAVLARTYTGNFLIEYRNQNGHLRRDIVWAKNVAVGASN